MLLFTTNEHVGYFKRRSFNTIKMVPIKLVQHIHVLFFYLT